MLSEEFPRRRSEDARMAARDATPTFFVRLARSFPACIAYRGYHVYGRGPRISGITSCRSTFVWSRTGCTFNAHSFTRRLQLIPTPFHYYPSTGKGGVSQYTRRSLARAFSTTQAQSSDRKAAVILTPSAVQKLHQLSEKWKTPVMLRLAVDSGGCGGFSYHYNVEEQTKIQADDIIFEQDGAKVAVDPVSYTKVDGANVDYTTSMMKSAFQVTYNPHAAAKCGCGTSFTPKDD